MCDKSFNYIKPQEQELWFTRGSIEGKWLVNVSKESAPVSNILTMSYTTDFNLLTHKLPS